MAIEVEENQDNAVSWKLRAENILRSGTRSSEPKGFKSSRKMAHTQKMPLFSRATWRWNYGNQRYIGMVEE